MYLIYIEGKINKVEKDKYRWKKQRWTQRAIMAMPDMTIALVINIVIYIIWTRIEVIEYGQAIGSLEDTVVNLIFLWINYIAVKYYRRYHDNGKMGKYYKDLADAIKGCQK